jgi:DNA mismatch endonuclease, patch repair protein
LADIVTPEVRSRMMSGIRGRNTKPELVVRSGLHRMGFRYRLHGPKLPGKPDLVFPGRRAVIEVRGCFWHGHACHLFRWPGSREAFWREKIAGNVQRDLRNRELLLEQGWRVAEIWECQLKGRERRPAEEVLARLAEFLEGEEQLCVIGGDLRVTDPVDTRAL